jgi:predicted DNA-binding transcriptional regulator AlpA
MSEQHEEPEERLKKSQKKIQKWLSKGEVAARFGVCMKSVERWGKSGKFPAGRQLQNTRWVWSVAEIEEYERSLDAAA